MPGTGPPRTLESLLPGVFLEPVDRKEERGGPEFVSGFCAGLDCVLTPATVTLDCIEAYFDPRLTPADYLDWLAGWVGLSLDQNWPEGQRRTLVMEAGDLYRWHGTVRGIIEHIRLFTGVVPEVHDSGGVAWSTTPDGNLPGSSVAELRVRLTVGTEDDLDLNRLEGIVTSVKPAHVPHIIDVVRRPDVKWSPPPPTAFPGRGASQGPPPPTLAPSPPVGPTEQDDGPQGPVGPSAQPNQLGPDELPAPPPSPDDDEGQETS
jgi:phage tail-like protein